MSVASVFKIKAIFNMLFIFSKSFQGIREGFNVNAYSVQVLIGLKQLGGRVLRYIFQVRRSILLYRPLIILVQVVRVSSSLTPIREAFSLEFKDSTRQLIKASSFHLVSLAQWQNLAKYNRKLLELYIILFNFLYTIIIRLGSL